MSANVHFDTRSADDYRRFLAIRRLPLYRFRGTSAEVPDEYISQIGLDKNRAATGRQQDLFAEMDEVIHSGASQ